MSTPIASVLLVDARGWLLLQERDSAAPRNPDRWGMPGGHVEAGEGFEDAAYRELEEETGLVLQRGHLYLWRDETLTGEDEEPVRVHVYAGRVDRTTDEDIVCGEGRRIVFVDPAQVDSLALADSAAVLLPAFLASTDYTRLAGFTDGGGHETQRGLTSGDDPQGAGAAAETP